MKKYKAFLFGISTLLLGSPMQLEGKPSKVINSSGKTYATLEQTRAEDGSVVVAIGFTPQKPGVPPIKWEKYEGDEELQGLLGDRDWEDGTEPKSGSKADYFAETVLLEGDAKKLHPLKFPAHQILPSSNRLVEGEWSANDAGQRVGVLIGQARNGTMALSMIRLRQGQLLEDDLADKMTKGIESELKKVHGKKFQLYEHMRFALASKVTEKEFFVRCDNGERNEPAHTVFMRVVLQDGIRMERVGQSGGFSASESEFKTADAELNRAYKTLVQKLSKKEVEDLRLSQRGWISERDEAVKRALKSAKLREESPDGKAFKRAALFLLTARRTHLLEHWGQ